MQPQSLQSSAWESLVIRALGFLLRAEARLQVENACSPEEHGARWPPCGSTSQTELRGQDLDQRRQPLRV